MVSGTIGTTLVKVRRALHAAVESPTWSLSDAEIVAGLADVAAARAQLADLELRLVAQAERNDTAATVGAASTKAMWANTTRQTRPVAARRVALATALEERRVLTREAMARGEVSEEQASVIVAAVDALPTDLDPSVVELAEKELVSQAGYFDQRELKRLGDRVLEVVAPDVADDHERRLLEREEARAAEQVRFTMSDDGHGLIHGRFTLPSAAGAMLRKAVLAHWRPGGSMGEAFRSYVERYPVDRLPDAGGVAATLVVTMTLDDLRDNLPATLDTGHRISPGEARRLACEAGIIPTVLGSRSEVLDVGRQARFHTKTQRIAIAQRDRTCTAVGCDQPPGLCHVHHDVHWAHGGHTTVTDGRLLCPKHHRWIHSTSWTTSPAEGGRLVFRRT